MSNDGIDDDDQQGPVGFLGWLRDRKWIVWVTIIGLAALSVGASSIVWLLRVL